jgi:hypothetical protein
MLNICNDDNPSIETLVVIKGKRVKVNQNICGKNKLH